MFDLALYFDDSGTHQQSDIAVASCYVSSVAQWKEFERNWKEVNEQFHFGMFHMADFVAKRKQFSGWEKSKRDALIRQLIGVIKTRVRIGFTAAVFKSDYDKLVPDDLKDRLGHFHYTFAVRQCLSMIHKWRLKYFISSPMQYVFEDGTKGKGEILSTFDRIREENYKEAFGLVSGGYSFVPKTPGLPQLQSADILAWESSWHLRNSVASTLESETPKRASLRELSKSPLVSSFFHERNLRALIDKIQQVDAERALDSLGPTPLY